MIIKTKRSRSNNGFSCLCKCDNCGKNFWRSKSNTGKTKNQFCCKDCSNSFKTKLTGKYSSAWKGGKPKHSSGYIRVLRPDHPHCDTTNYVLEHRLVMEKELGRYLKSEEIVHHIDHDKSNNDINNLELLDKSSHSKTTVIEIKKDKTGKFSRS